MALKIRFSHKSANHPFPIKIAIILMVLLYGVFAPVFSENPTFWVRMDPGILRGWLGAKQRYAMDPGESRDSPKRDGTKVPPGRHGQKS